MTEREQFQQKYELLGNSAEMQEIIDVILQVAPTDLTVLITGESGTGKEVVAKAIHAISKRNTKPMLSVNCGAIPEGLMESELFGHERGAFTGATEMRQGYFEIADNGTIFLDEIGEMPIGTQVKLLRVLESGEYMRVGSSVARRTNARVIAATNKLLEYEVQQKRFRADLYFRLRSVNLQLPPLRNRKEDIPAIVEHVVQQVTKKNHLRFAGFTDDATDVLMRYHWPGNIRELKNAIESMLIMEGGKTLHGDDVKKYLQEPSQVIADRNLPVVSNKSVEQAERELIYRALVDLKASIVEIQDMLSHKVSGSSNFQPLAPDGGVAAVTMDEMERRMIQQALDRNNGSRRMAARELHISERSLYRKIKYYGLLG